MPKNKRNGVRVFTLSLDLLDRVEEAARERGMDGGQERRASELIEAALEDWLACHEAPAMLRQVIGRLDALEGKVAEASARAAVAASPTPGPWAGNGNGRAASLLNGAPLNANGHGNGVSLNGSGAALNGSGHSNGNGNGNGASLNGSGHSNGNGNGNGASLNGNGNGNANGHGASLNGNGYGVASNGNGHSNANGHGASLNGNGNGNGHGASLNGNGHANGNGASLNGKGNGSRASALDAATAGGASANGRSPSSRESAPKPRASGTSQREQRREAVWTFLSGQANGSATTPPLPRTTLQQATGITAKGVQTALQDLIDGGQIAIASEGRGAKANAYEVVERPAN